MNFDAPLFFFEDNHVATDHTTLKDTVGGLGGQAGSLGRLAGCGPAWRASLAAWLARWPAGSQLHHTHHTHFG